jgi:glycerophosphoryl diester phosphodiesterase
MNRRPPPAKRRRRGPGAGPGGPGNAAPGGAQGPVVNGNGAPAAPLHEGGSSQPAPVNLKVIAHRGYRALYPENTLKSLREAINVGARFIEFDLQLTADAVPVLFHDNELERVCGRPGKVFETPAADFLKLKAAEAWRFGPTRHANEPVATLEQAVQLLLQHPEVFVFAELKDGSVFKHGVDACYAALAPLLRPLATRLALISFDTDFLVHARERGEFRLGAVLREWEEREVSAMRFIEPDYLFCDVRGVPDTGRLSHGRAEIGIFEVDEARRAVEFGRRGVTFIETFAVAELSQQLARSSSQRGDRRPPRDPGQTPPGQGRDPREPREQREVMTAQQVPEPPPALTVPQEPEDEL